MGGDVTVEEMRFREWMRDTVKLPQYIGLLLENGFDDIDTLSMVNVDQLQSIGIEKLGHRLKIIKFIQAHSHVGQ